ncbi:MAG: gamma-glutamylcyclotransferase family protein [Candidatus Thiodiazotropha endolucinida]
MSAHLLYFSYGSNMSSRRLLSRVPSARFVTSASLPGHELHFHKKSLDGSAKCDAYETKSDRHAVSGVIFEIAKSEKAGLDSKEGLGQGYEEKTVELIDPDGEMVVAYTYYAISIDRTLKPYHWYKHHVLTGALEYDLPAPYIDRLRLIESMEDPDPQRHAFELAIYANSMSSIG